MDDIRAVMDATGSRRAALIATGDAGAMATLFAATYPERVAAVVLWSPYARGTAAADYPIGETEAEWQRQLDEIEQGWGTRAYPREAVRQDPGLSSRMTKPLFEWFCETLRCAASPGAALTVYRMAMEVDVRDVLPAIRVPVLILHRATTRTDAEFMTERIPGARRVEIPGRASIFGDGVEQTLSEIERFLATATGKAEPETRALDGPLHRYRRLDRTRRRARRPPLARDAREPRRDDSPLSRPVQRAGARHSR